MFHFKTKIQEIGGTASDNKDGIHEFGAWSYLLKIQALTHKIWDGFKFYCNRNWLHRKIDCITNNMINKYNY